MEKNARVDVVGRNHEGKQIYKVTIEGAPKELYLVDAHTDCTIKTSDIVTEPHIVDPPPIEPEPQLEGRMACGLNAKWIEWYRANRDGRVNLREAMQEGLRLLEIKRKNPRQ